MEATEPSQGDIAADAYARYVARGCQDGHDVEDWLAAEHALRAASTADRAPGPRSAPPDHEGATENNVADRTGPGAGYDQEKVVSWTET